MEALGVAALLMMLLAVVVLIIVLLEVRKNAKRKAKAAKAKVKISGSLKKSGSSDRTPAEAVRPVERNPEDGCIYQYREYRSLWRCPDCDGENPMTRSSCRICGCAPGGYRQ